MKSIASYLGLALLCASASACTFLDDLDRSIEEKAGALTAKAAQPAAPSPPPPVGLPAQPSPPAAPPMPPPAPVPVPMPEPPMPPGVPKVALGKVVVHGSLADDAVSRIVSRHINELRFCYEQSRTASARISIKFIIDPKGAVQVASIEESSTDDEKLQRCFAQAVRRWTFPAPEGGGIVVATLPLELSRVK